MMQENTPQTSKKNKPDSFNLVFEVFGWLRIVASPLLAGAAIGLVVYVSKPDDVGLIIAIAIAVAGLVTGVIWATKIWKKESTLDYSATSSPDLDKCDEAKSDDGR